MNFKYSLLLFVSLAVLSTGSSYAQQATDIHKFNRTDEYRLQKAQGTTNFPDDIRTVERMDSVGYMKNGYIWNIDHGRNMITYRRFEGLGAPMTISSAKKTAAEIQKLATEKFLNLQWINNTYYATQPVVFDVEDAKCSTPNYKPYCSYVNSAVVFYPYWYQQLPVYHEDGSAVGLVIVLDHSTGEIVYASGLITNQTQLADITGENLLTGSQINAYVTRTRLFDQETYLVPAMIDSSKVSFSKDLSRHGFSPLMNGIPVVEAKPVLVEPEVIPTQSGKLYEFDGLSLHIPQDKGIESRDRIITTTRFKSLIIFKTGGRAIGRLFVLPKTQTAYKNVLTRRGASQLYETANHYVMLSFTSSIDRELLTSAAGFFSFDER